MVKLVKKGMLLVCSVCHCTVAPNEKEHTNCSFILKMKGCADEVMRHLIKNGIEIKEEVVLVFKELKKSFSFRKTKEVGAAFYEALVMFHQGGAFAPVKFKEVTAGFVSRVEHIAMILGRMEEFRRTFLFHSEYS